MLEQVQNVNKHVKIESVFADTFKRFGRIVDVDAKPLLNALKMMPMPDEGNCYVADESRLVSDVTEYFKETIFDNNTIQTGYVNGFNSKLNALEFHKASEVNVCLEPIILILAHKNDIKDNMIHSSDTSLYYIPAKTVIELYEDVLHFSPCKVFNKGFRCAVVLPKHTNTEFVKDSQDRLLFKTNKWLLAHKEHEAFINLGAHEGIKGDNITINTVDEVDHD